MFRCLIAVCLCFCVPVCAAAQDVLTPADAVRIEVAPEDLDRCKTVLAQVVAAPVETAQPHDHGGADLPQVICVVMGT